MFFSQVVFSKEKELLDSFVSFQVQYFDILWLSNHDTQQQRRFKASFLNSVGLNSYALAYYKTQVTEKKVWQIGSICLKQTLLRSVTKQRERGISVLTSLGKQQTAKHLS